MAQSTLEVSLLGSKTVKVKVGPTASVRETLLAAADALGVNINPDAVGAIVNGRQVTTDQTVTDGDTVTAAANVANG